MLQRLVISACLLTFSGTANSGAPIHSAVQEKTELTDVRGEDFPDGRPKSRITFRGDDPHGLAQEWWPNGRLHWEVTYRNGKRHGTLRMWYETGQLESIREYVDGKKHGPFTDYHSNGLKAAEGRYERDHLKVLQEWDDNGRLVDPK